MTRIINPSNDTVTVTRTRIEKYCTLNYDNEITLLIGKIYTCMDIAKVTNH